MGEGIELPMTEEEVMDWYQSTDDWEEYVDCTVDDEDGAERLKHIRDDLKRKLGTIIVNGRAKFPCSRTVGSSEDLIRSIEKFSDELSAG